MIYVSQCPPLHCTLYSIKQITESPACMCGFVNEDEFDFLFVCPLYNRPEVALQNAISHIAPLALKTLFYGSDNVALCTMISEVNLSAFIYRLFHEDFFTIILTNILDYS